MSLLLLFGGAPAEPQLTYAVYDGATLIRSEVFTPSASYVTSAVILTEAERDAITSWPPTVWVTKAGQQIDVSEVWFTHPESLTPAIKIPVMVASYRRRRL